MATRSASLAVQDLARAERRLEREILNRRRSEILAQTAGLLLSGEDPDREVMPALFRALVAERIVDATLGFIVVDGSGPMKLVFMEGFDAAMIQRCLTLDFGQAICGTVALTRTAMHVTDIQRSLDPISELVRAEGISAYACEPLIVADRLLGTLSFASRRRRSFDAEDILFFRAIAKQVAIARERQRRVGVPASSS
ncbi:MAG TPA: GAF domain-containing protein [Sphingomicrobium sp.]|nr:GAF domain-containing protein [Sphingomicrobium sp.]